MKMTRVFNYLFFATALILSTTACKKEKSPDPSFISLLPTAAFEGDTLTLVVKNFPQDLSNVKFRINNSPSTPIILTKDTIQLIVPLKAGSGPIAAIINGQTYNGPQFTYKRTAIVTTIAGTGYAGFKDAQGLSAAFNSPLGIATDNKGNLFVADSYNGAIRKISLETGNVSSHRIIITDGKSFHLPYDIAVDPVTEDIYATDFNSHVMRMDSLGNASVIFEEQGLLSGIALSPDRKSLYICSTIAGTIIKTGIDGSNPRVFCSGLLNPRSIIFDPTGKMYVAAYPYAVYSVSPQGTASPAVNAPHFGGSEIARDSTGNFYLADYTANNIQMCDRNGMLTVVAGSGKSEDFDGKGLEASFDCPRGLTIDKDGNLFVSTSNLNTMGGNRIRKITFE